MARLGLPSRITRGLAVARAVTRSEPRVARYAGSVRSCQPPSECSGAAPTTPRVPSAGHGGASRYDGGSAYESLLVHHWPAVGSVHGTIRPCDEGSQWFRRSREAALPRGCGDGLPELDQRLSEELERVNADATKGVAPSRELTVQIFDDSGELAAGMSGWTWGVAVESVSPGCVRYRVAMGSAPGCLQSSRMRRGLGGARTSSSPLSPSKRQASTSATGTARSSDGRACPWTMPLTCTSARTSEVPCQSRRAW